jgi:BMFP domain-containing protein YqiC
VTDEEAWAVIRDGFIPEDAFAPSTGERLEKLEARVAELEALVNVLASLRPPPEGATG